MKCSELLRILKRDGWYSISQKGSHIKMMHPEKTNILIVPDHGSHEIGKGLEKKILKDAGIKSI
jgi:mRNA interferase HicA